MTETELNQKDLTEKLSETLGCKIETENPEYGTSNVCLYRAYFSENLSSDKIEEGYEILEEALQEKGYEILGKNSLGRGYLHPGEGIPKAINTVVEFEQGEGWIFVGEMR